jgi:hypothetical protein
MNSSQLFSQLVAKITSRAVQFALERKIPRICTSDPYQGGKVILYESEPQRERFHGIRIHIHNIIIHRIQLVVYSPRIDLLYSDVGAVLCKKMDTPFSLVGSFR